MPGRLAKASSPQAAVWPSYEEPAVAAAAAAAAAAHRREIC